MTFKYCILKNEIKNKHSLVFIKIQKHVILGGLAENWRMLQNEQRKRLGVDTFNRRIWHICKSTFLLSIVIMSSGAELSADCSHTALWCCPFWSNRKILQSFPRKEWLTQWQHKPKEFWNRKGFGFTSRFGKCKDVFDEHISLLILQLVWLCEDFSHYSHSVC